MSTSEVMQAAADYHDLSVEALIEHITTDNGTSLMLEYYLWAYPDGW